MADVTISSLTQGTPGSTASIPFSDGSSTLRVAPGNILANAGNVGIGTTSPRSRLDIGSNLGVGNGFRSGDYLEINELENYNNASYISWNTIQNGTGTFVPVYAPGQGIIIAQNGGGGGSLDIRGYNWGGNSSAVGFGSFNQIMYLQYDGKVGIGTSTPSSKLHVAGDVTVTGTINGNATSATTASNGAKAWVNFTPSSSDNTNCTLNNSYNISSVVRETIDRYKINFSSALTSSFYAVAGCGRYPSDTTNDGSPSFGVWRGADAMTSTYVRVVCQFSGGSYSKANIYATIFC